MTYTKEEMKLKLSQIGQQLQDKKDPLDYIEFMNSEELRQVARSFYGEIIRLKEEPIETKESIAFELQKQVNKLKEMRDSIVGIRRSDQADRGSYTNAIWTLEQRIREILD